MTLILVQRVVSEGCWEFQPSPTARKTKPCVKRGKKNKTRRGRNASPRPEGGDGCEVIMDRHGSRRVDLTQAGRRVNKKNKSTDSNTKDCLCLIRRRAVAECMLLGQWFESSR